MLWMGLVAVTTRKAGAMRVLRREKLCAVPVRIVDALDSASQQAAVNRRPHGARLRSNCKGLINAFAHLVDQVVQQPTEEEKVVLDKKAAVGQMQRTAELWHEREVLAAELEVCAGCPDRHGPIPD